MSFGRRATAFSVLAASIAGGASATVLPGSESHEPLRLDGLGFKAPGRTLSWSPAGKTKRYASTTKAKRKAAKRARRRNRKH